MDVRKCRLVAAAAGFCLIGGNATAHDRSVSVKFSGTLPPKCVLNNPNAAVDLGALQPKGTASVSFALSCNADFHFTLASRNGGLVQAGTPAFPHFVTQIPYTVSLYLGGTRISQNAGCQSGSMTGALPTCAGVAGANIGVPSSQNATLRFSWDFTGKVPVAGLFQDTLLLTVGPDF